MDLTKLQRWADLLRPCFLPPAELELMAGSGQLRFRWPRSHVVAIFIAPHAVADYLEAQDVIRARADYNLREFIRENLIRLNPKHQGEFRIVVASIDFVPLK